MKISVVAVSLDRKSTRLNSSHVRISYAVFCLKKKRQVHLRDIWPRDCRVICRCGVAITSRHPAAPQRRRLPHLSSRPPLRASPFLFFLKKRPPPKSPPFPPPPLPT